MPCKFAPDRMELVTMIDIAEVSAWVRTGAEAATSYRELYLGAMAEVERLRVELATRRSPQLDLSRALVRVWRNPRMGILAEMKLTPTSEPIYKRITEEEAKLLAQPEPPPELVGSLFIPEAPPAMH